MKFDVKMLTRFAPTKFYAFAIDFVVFAFVAIVVVSLICIYIHE